MKKNKYTGLLLVFSLIAGLAIPAYAATTQEQINQAQAEQQATRSQLSSVQNRIQELDSKRGQTENYLSELTGQLEELTQRLTELQDQYAAKQQELVEVQAELDDAREKEESEYQAMKLRIQYMYETSCTESLLTMLCNAKNIAELVSRVEYFQTISDYDRSLTEEYHNTVLEVQEKENRVEEEKTAIEVLQKENAEQQEAIQELYAATYVDLRDCLEQLDAAEESENSLAVQIQQQENRINELIRKAKEEELEAQRRAEEEARAAREAAAREAAAQAVAAQAAAQTAAAAQNSSSAETAASSGSSASSTPSSSQQTSQPAQTTQQQAAAQEEPQQTSSSNRTYLGNFKTTAYCACAKCCGKWAGGHTASGTVPTAGRTVAMGGIAFGTKLEINGVVYTVEDRGTAYGHVDIFFNSHQDALNYGLRYADVYLIE